MILTGECSGNAFAAFGLSYGEPAGSFLNGGFEFQIAFADVVDGHLDGIGSGGIDYAAAHDFQRGTADNFRYGFSGKAVNVSGSSVAVVNEETEARINVLAVAVGQIEACHHIFAEGHRQQLVIAFQHVHGVTNVDPFAEIVLIIYREVIIGGVGMEPKISIPVLEIEFAGAVVAAEIDAVAAYHIIDLDSEGNFDVVVVGSIFGVGKGRMSAAHSPDMLNFKAFLMTFITAFHHIVSFLISGTAVDRLPAAVLGKNVAKFHIAEVRLIEETVLPNDLRNFLAVRAAVNGYGRFVAAAGIFRIALQVDVLLVGQSSAGGVDGKPFGAAGNREADLGVGAAIVDGCLQFGRAERNSDHVGSKDARLGKARHSFDLDAVIEGLFVGAHGFVLRGKAQLNIVGGPRAGDAALIGHAVDAAGHDLAVHGVPEDPTVTVIANVDVVKCETAGAGAAFAGVAVEV